MGYQAPQTDPVLALKPLTLWTSGCGLPSCRPADRMGAGVQRRSPEQAQTGPKRARPPMHTNTATSSCCQCGWSHGGRASSLLSMVAGGPAGPRQHISLGPQVQCLAASSWLAGRPEACGGQPEGVGHLSVLVGSPGACCGDRAAWNGESGARQSNVLGSLMCTLASANSARFSCWCSTKQQHFLFRPGTWKP